MRHFEIILKFAFIIGAGYLYINQPNTFWCTAIFLLICLTLGITLIFNKKASYNFRQTKRDLAIRQVEGWILLVFVLTSVFAALYIK